MSTKATIAHGDHFHFYHEVPDDDHVYLELNTTHFEAGYGRVILPIPIHIWEVIRHLGGARLDLVGKTDEDLLAMVEGEVDARIAEYQAEKPREEQIVRGMEYFRGEQQRQREVRDAIEKLRAAQLRASSRDQDRNVWRRQKD